MQGAARSPGLEVSHLETDRKLAKHLYSTVMGFGDKSSSKKFLAKTRGSVVSLLRDSAKFQAALTESTPNVADMESAIGDALSEVLKAALGGRQPQVLRMAGTIRSLVFDGSARAQANPAAKSASLHVMEYKDAQDETEDRKELSYKQIHAAQLHFARGSRLEKKVRAKPDDDKVDKWTQSIANAKKEARKAASESGVEGKATEVFSFVSDEDVLALDGADALYAEVLRVVEEHPKAVSTAPFIRLMQASYDSTQQRCAVPTDYTTAAGSDTVKYVLGQASSESDEVQLTKLCGSYVEEITAAIKYLWRLLKKGLSEGLWQDLMQPNVFGIQRTTVDTNVGDAIRVVWKLGEKARTVKCNEVAELMARVAASPKMFREFSSLEAAVPKMIKLLNDAAKLDVAIRWELCGMQIRDSITMMPEVASALVLRNQATEFSDRKVEASTGGRADSAPIIRKMMATLQAVLKAHEGSSKAGGDKREKIKAVTGEKRKREQTFTDKVCGVKGCSQECNPMKGEKGKFQLICDSCWTKASSGDGMELTLKDDTKFATRKFRKKEAGDKLGGIAKHRAGAKAAKDADKATGKKLDALAKAIQQLQAAGNATNAVVDKALEAGGCDAAAVRKALKTKKKKKIKKAKVAQSATDEDEDE